MNNVWQLVMLYHTNIHENMNISPQKKVRIGGSFPGQWCWYIVTQSPLSPLATWQHLGISLITSARSPGFLYRTRKTTQTPTPDWQSKFSPSVNTNSAPPPSNSRLGYKKKAGTRAEYRFCYRGASAPPPKWLMVTWGTVFIPRPLLARLPLCVIRMGCAQDNKKDRQADGYAPVVDQQMTPQMTEYDKNDVLGPEMEFGLRLGSG